MGTDQNLDDKSAPLSEEIDKDFQPQNGAFFRTLEFPETDAEGKTIGKVWMEAGRDPQTADWVLWQKSIREMDDLLMGGKSNVVTARVLFEKTSFVNAFDQMVTFEKSQKTFGVQPAGNKTKAKLGGDYYRHFAWREGLVISKSGRLYPAAGDQITAANFFDAQDLLDRKAYLERLATEQFVPVPLVLPAVDWKKAYEEKQDITDARLTVLYHRYGDDRDSYDLALQIVGQEAPEVLYAHLKQGFNPKIFQEDAAKHFALAKSAIERENVEVLNLLSEAGLSFHVRHKGMTPVELAMQAKRYSHLYVMLSRDGASLANYCDENGTAPAVHAMSLKDNQAFRMFYLEGLDYSHTDRAGYALVHHAFANNFFPGVYAWIDEGLSINEPVKGAEYTGLSLARDKGYQALVDFALKNGANPVAPSLAKPASEKPSETSGAVVSPPVVVAKPKHENFSIDILNSSLTNAEIEKLAAAYVAAGGNLNITDTKKTALLELCWKNHKPTAEFDRRGLIPALCSLGADPAAVLDDGTTVLTRAVSGVMLDINFIKAVAPFAKDPNTADSAGNNILHVLQLNENDQIGNSGNVSAILKALPGLDINRQNNDGYSNIGLAIRLNRSQTLKVLATSPADWAQTTKAGWSYLDIAFTKACGAEKVNGAPRADKIETTSDIIRTVVLDMLDKNTKSLADAFNRPRPDGKTLSEALAAEQISPPIANRLAAHQGNNKPGP